MERNKPWAPTPPASPVDPPASETRDLRGHLVPLPMHCGNPL